MTQVLQRISAYSRRYCTPQNASSSVISKCNFNSGISSGSQSHRFLIGANSPIVSLMWQVTSHEITHLTTQNDSNVSYNCKCFFHTSSTCNRGRLFAIRRRRKIAVRNKALKEARLAKNPPPLPYKVQLMLAAKGLGGPPKPIREKDDKKFVADNIYFMEECAWKRWTFEEAIKELRLNHHPSIGYSNPDGLLFAKIEFNLKTKKIDTYMDGFSKMVPIIYPYERGVPDRSVCAFVPTPEMEKVAIEAGAVQTGGEEFIREISKGRVELSDIDHFVAHEELAGSVNVLAGILRDKLPRAKDGTIGSDIPLLVGTFIRGMDVDVKKPKSTLGVAEEPDYGFCEAPIGRLDMDIAAIESNLTVLLQKLNENRPKRKEKDDDSFITRCILRVEGTEGLGEEFSIIHPEVSDKRVQEQEQVITEGRKIIKERVHMLKQK